MIEIAIWPPAIDLGREEAGKSGIGNGSMMSTIESQFHLEGADAFINETARPPYAPCTWLIRGPLALVKHERTSDAFVVRGAGGIYLKETLGIFAGGGVVF